MTEYLQENDFISYNFLYSKENISFLEKVGDYFRLSPENPDIKSIGLRWFQEKGLLKPFILHFNASTEQVFDAVYGLHTHLRSVRSDSIVTPQPVKPLLTTEDALSIEEFRQEFSQRVEEISDAIQSTQDYQVVFDITKKILKSKASFRMYGSSNKKHPDKFKNRLREKIRDARRNKRKAEDEANLKLEEYKLRDINTVIDKYINEKDTVCCVLDHDADVIVPSLVIGKTNRRNKLYVSSGDANTRDTLFESFFQRLVDAEEIKGITANRNRREKAKEGRRRKLMGGLLIPELLRSHSIGFFSQRLRDEDWYSDAFRLRNTKIPEEFYLYWNIVPMGRTHLGSLSAFDGGRLDKIIFAQAINSIPEKDKQAAIWAADRSLKVGGYLLFNDGAYQQAVVEYYGAELFVQKYKRMTPKGLHHPAYWMIFQKVGNSFNAQETSTSPFSISHQVTEKSPPLDIRQELIPAPEITSQISVEIQSRQEKVVYEAQGGYLSATKDKKNFYTVRQIAKIAEVKVSDVKRQVRQLGIELATGSKRLMGKRSQGRMLTFEEAQIVLSELEEKKVRKNKIKFQNDPAELFEE